MADNENAPVSKYAEVAYNELRALAASRNLPSAGTKEELIARLEEADANGDGGDTNEEGEGDQKGEGEGSKEEGNEGGDEPPPPPTRPAPRRTAPLSSREIEQVYRSKAERIKAHLAKQPKVMIFIPFESGENPEQAGKIMMHVNINGYFMDIPRGTPVEVPKQIADMVMERLASEGKAGREHLVSGNPDREVALGE